MSAMRPRDGYFFDDFTVGQILTHATPRTVTEGDVALYIALTGSRFAPYCSRPLAKAMGYGDLPIDPLLAFHIAFGKTVPDVSLNAVANLGYADLRFLAPVYVGDTLSAESEVIGLKVNSNGKSGVVYVRSRAYAERVDGSREKVLTWARWVMVQRRAGALPATLPTTVVPNLPAKVEPELLDVPITLQPAAMTSQITGSTRLLGDYLDGEVIDHPQGMTVDESDHTLATKLYQNTARVHFDAHVAASSRFGKRLMYGGHVISICRALSYEGLENAFTIAAINAGSHAQPTFAGDTLYCRSIVLERALLPTNDRLGAMRLRMIGVKNARLADVPYTAVAGDDERIVLDLDYTVVIPR
jgi:2-methylfumaryl-CoA hydratase